MNTLATITSSSTLSSGIIPSSTASATAFATAAWAGPNIRAACGMSCTVTFGTISVAGFVKRLGRMTESRGVCPAESWVIPVANAVPTGPFLSPIITSTCASSGSSPINASPINNNLFHL